MNNLIPQHEIDRIRDSVNIVDVIDGYVKLKKAGGSYSACCPFHGEKTPSFHVKQDKQFFNCFGCGASGDVFKFIQDYTGCTFVEAVESIESNIRYDADPEQTEKRRRSKLPFDGAGIDFYNSVPIDETTGLRLVKGAEVLLTRSLSGEPQSCLLFDGFARKPFKKAWRGCCIDFGEITDKAIVCFDLALAKKIYIRKEIPVIYLTDSGQIWKMYHHRNKGEGRDIKFMPVCTTKEEINDCCHLAGFKIGLNENMKKINLEEIATHHSIVDDGNVEHFAKEFGARIV